MRQDTESFDLMVEELEGLVATPVQVFQRSRFDAWRPVKYVGQALLKMLEWLRPWLSGKHRAWFPNNELPLVRVDDILRECQVIKGGDDGVMIYA